MMEKMNKKRNIELKKCEERLLRRVNILNSLGLFQLALINNGYISKTHYTEAVSKNYLYSDVSNLPVNIIDTIDKIWTTSCNSFQKMKLLIFSSNEIIKIKDPIDYFLDIKSDGD